MVYLPAILAYLATLEAANHILLPNYIVNFSKNTKTVKSLRIRHNSSSLILMVSMLTQPVGTITLLLITNTNGFIDFQPVQKGDWINFRFPKMFCETLTFG